MPFRREERILLGSSYNQNEDVIHVRLESQSSIGITTNSRQPPRQRYRYHHPLVSSDAVELLTQYGAVRIHMQVASIASNHYPESALDEHVFSDALMFHGPPGVSVSVDFLSQESNDSFNDDNHNYKERFLALLQELVGKRRILAAPLGLSMRRPELHRYIEVETIDTDTSSSISNSGNVITRVTTILPIEGAAVAFSMEGLRSFLHQATAGTVGSEKVGLWNMVTPMEWSSWLLGNVPSNLEEAQAFMATTDPWTLRQVSTGPHLSMTHHRRGFFMDWSASSSCHASAVADGKGSGSSNNNDCRIETSYGLQYAMAVSSADNTMNATWPPMRLSLSDVLPDKRVDLSSPSPSFQPDVFADESVVQLLGKGDVQWSRDPACALTLNDNTNDETLLSMEQVLQEGYRSRPCLELRRRFHSTDATTVNQSSLPASSSPLSQPYWSVHYHAARQVGQAYRGRLTVTVLHNPNTHLCSSTQVAVMQVLPAVLEPQWRSMVIVIHTPNNQTTQRLQWDELDDSHVDFRADGSICLSFQHVLPKQSESLQVGFDYEPSFLSHESFPGDANRGFEIPPVRATFRMIEQDASDQCVQHWREARGTAAAESLAHVHPSVTLYSNALLVLAPLPDMSMPFNVISLTCTFYAFVIGSLLNLAIKKASAQIKKQVDPDNVEHQGLLARLKAKLRKRFGKRPTGESTSTAKAGPKDPSSSHVAGNPVTAATAEPTVTIAKKDDE